MQELPQVFYRKWRPQCLADVVGQDHITATLRQAVIQSRIAHAYMFCGPRGTGKTSTARILAKAINCPYPNEGEPCDQCQICKAMSEGRALDLVEIDAASHRGIDDMRNLRERIHFTPAEATYKVYIVDEVHMLTNEAFNTLLKTLEEPPPHAIFVLATTEAHKVPPTVISRCQRFDFHRISQSHLEARLTQICEEEGIKAEPNALKAIGLNSSGSLRDAENILEQLVVSHDSNISLAHVRNLLGIGDDETALALVNHILRGEASEGLSIINTVADQGLDLRRFQLQILDYLRGVLLLSAGVSDTLGHMPETLEPMKEMAKSSTLEHVLRSVRVFEQASPKQDGPATLSMELAIIDCCLDIAPLETTDASTEVTVTPTNVVQERPSSLKVDTSTNIEETSKEDNLEHTLKVSFSEKLSEAEADPFPIDTPPLTLIEEVGIQANGIRYEQGSVSRNLPEAHWDALRKATKRLKVTRFNIGALLQDCVERYIEEDTLVLVFKTQPNLERLQGEMENPDTRRLIHETVEQVIGTPYKLILTLESQGTTSTAITTGHLVRAARAMGAHILEEIPEEENQN